jgi:hypothetical protein
MILFSTFFIHVEEASASPLEGELMALSSGAGYVAGGLYALSGLLVAAGGAAVGSAHADAIKQSAMNVWDKLDSAGRDLWVSAVQSSVANGINTVTVSKEMNDSLSTVAGYLSDEARKLVAREEIFESPLVSEVYHGDGFKSISMEGMVWSASIFSDPVWEMHDFSGEIYLTAGGTTVAHKYYSSGDMDQYLAISNYGTFVDFIQDYFNLSLDVAYVDTVAPAKDYYDTAVDAAITGLSGVKEINIPLDQFLAKNATGENVTYDEPTSTVLNPDGSTYTGEIAWDYPIPGVATPTAIGNPAVPISTVVQGDIPFVNNPPIVPPVPPGTNPFKDLIPVAFLMAFLDLLRAIIEYLVRMFTFVLTIPLIPTKPIDNAAFEWFRNAKIMGVYIFQLVSSMASIGLSFAVYRSIRRLLP